MGVSVISSAGQGSAYTTYVAPEPVSAATPVAEPVIKEPAAAQKPPEAVIYSDPSKTANAEIPALKDEGGDAKKHIEAMTRLAKQIKGASLSFSYHEKTHRVMFKLTDEETKEVIREVPAEKVLDAIASMLEAAGVFVDEKR